MIILLELPDPRQDILILAPLRIFQAPRTGATRGIALLSPLTVLAFEEPNRYKERKLFCAAGGPFDWLSGLTWTPGSIAPDVAQRALEICVGHGSPDTVMLRKPVSDTGVKPFRSRG